MFLSVGQSHSLASTGRGKVYAWGWNDNGQCARDPYLLDEVVIKESIRSAQIDLRKFQKAVPAGQPEQAARCKQI